MKTIMEKLARFIATPVLLGISLVGVSAHAADVEYQASRLSIAAVNESLDSVLRSVSVAMDIEVSMPSDLHTPINCDIENKPVKQALKTLLIGVSYALRWDEESGHLAGLVVLGGGYGDFATDRRENTAPENRLLASGQTSITHDPVYDERAISGLLEEDTHIADEVSRSAAGAADYEAWMALDGEQHAARMAEMRLEEEARMAQEMVEEAARAEAEIFEEYDD